MSNFIQAQESEKARSPTAEIAERVCSGTCEIADYASGDEVGAPNGGSNA